MKAALLLITLFLGIGLVYAQDESADIGSSKGMKKKGLTLEEIDIYQYEKDRKESLFKSLRNQYQTTSSNKEKEQIKREMEQVVAELFDLDVKEKEQELEKLRQQIQQIQNELDYRKKHKDRIVKKKMRELLNH